MGRLYAKSAGVRRNERLDIHHDGNIHGRMFRTVAGTHRWRLHGMVAVMIQTEGLSEAQKCNIRERYIHGDTVGQIATDMRISRMAVVSVLRRKRSESRRAPHGGGA